MLVGTDEALDVRSADDGRSVLDLGDDSAAFDVEPAITPGSLEGGCLEGAPPCFARNGRTARCCGLNGSRAVSYRSV